MSGSSIVIRLFLLVSLVMRASMGWIPNTGRLSGEFVLSSVVRPGSLLSTLIPIGLSKELYHGFSAMVRRMIGHERTDMAYMTLIVRISMITFDLYTCQSSLHHEKDFFPLPLSSARIHMHVSNLRGGEADGCCDFIS
jgi:hypothetical protein